MDGGGSSSRPAPVVASPQVEDKAVQEARAEQARRRARARGYRATVVSKELTGMPAGQGTQTTFGA